MKTLLQLMAPVRLSEDPAEIRRFRDDWIEAVNVIADRRSKEYPATTLKLDGIEVCGACGCLIFPGTTMVYQAESPPVHLSAVECELAWRRQRGD